MHKISEKSELLDVSWEDAVSYCNFVLLQPTWLPDGFSEIKNQIRTESPSERACHRVEYSNEKAAFSIKQFLYDWAPPAYDHPCLWRNEKISSPEDTPLPKPKLLGNNYMWFGLDYRRKPAATINMYRSQIELTVLSGNLELENMCQIFESLMPVSKTQEKAILNCSLAELTHASRHNSATVSVPTGYLKYLRKVKQKGYCYPAPELPENLIAESVANFNIGNYVLDSVFNFGSSDQAIDETEYYFEHVTHKGCYIRIMVTYVNNENAILYPAIVSDQECNFSELSMDNNLKIYHAWSKNNDKGCHSMIFKTNNFVLNCSIKPAPWTTLSFARDLCQRLHQYIERENR